MKPTTVDFETFGIETRPFYPPFPVGVSIKKWGKKSKYWAWGHRTGNNCTFGEAKAALAEAYATPDGVLFHNAKFDLDVAEVHMGLKIPEWQRIHDTFLMVFLDNPHSKDLGLKTVAEKLLEMPPNERDEVVEWLLENQPIPGIKIGKGKNAKHPAGKYIAYAPGELVGKYANGDTDRTEAVFRHLIGSLKDREMLPPYDRERKLLPVLLDMERTGVRVDHARLRADVDMYSGWMAKIDAWIRQRLGNPTMFESSTSDKIVPLNLDATEKLAAVLIELKKADPALMGITKTGKVSMNKESVEAGVTDKVLGAVLKYRSQLKTCLGTFMTTWLDMADASGGLIFTTWNQVKSIVGTRTGRLSSTPNFQNIPKEFAPIFGDGKKLPKCPWKDLPDLPLCRSYIVPYEDDHILIGRDYSQQEPRILAHFEDGALKQSYLDNPWIDYHDNAKEHLERVTGRVYQRKPVKNINLGIIYGQGVGSLAVKNESTVEETREIKDLIYALYPGLKAMYDDMRMRSKTDQPIRTWGGREYYCEPPMFIQGRMMTFDYKMVNVLVQGSAADCTKEAIIRFAHRNHNRGWKLLLQVHDEIVISCPASEAAECMELLRECMESVEFDVQILSEGAWSSKNWSDMQDYDKKGQLVKIF